MNQRYHRSANRRGGTLQEMLPVIHPSPAARTYQSPEAVKAWCDSGSLAIEPELAPVEYVRCPTCGRASDCCCPDCPHCDADGTPNPEEDTTRICYEEEVPDDPTNAV